MSAILPLLQWGRMQFLLVLWEELNEFQLFSESEKVVVVIFWARTINIWEKKCCKAEGWSNYLHLLFEMYSFFFFGGGDFLFVCCFSCRGTVEKVCVDVCQLWKRMLCHEKRVNMGTRTEFAGWHIYETGEVKIRTVPSQRDMYEVPLSMASLLMGIGHIVWASGFHLLLFLRKPLAMREFPYSGMVNLLGVHMLL